MSVNFPDPVHETATPVYADMGKRRFGYINFLGLWTLYCKEMRVFARFAVETILAPVITCLLFLFVFTYAFGDNRPSVANASFVDFLVPGMVMMTLMQHAFGNSSFSLLDSKIMGVAVDFLAAPLSPAETNLAFVAAATTCGMAVGICVLAAMAVFYPVPVAHVWAVLYFGIGASMMLGQMGLLAGIWAERFDHLQTVINFAITPLSFLSGTFYPINVLPSAGQVLCRGNPFFYLIDGFRYGFIGRAESNILIGMVMVAMLNIILWVLCHLAFRSGWRLKS